MTLLGCNMFAYCLNNPVNMVDYGGTEAITLGTTGIVIIMAVAVVCCMVVTSPEFQSSWNSMWTSIGYNIVTGVNDFIAGIEEVSGWISSKAKSIANGVESGFSKIKDRVKSATIALSISKAVAKTKIKIATRKNKYDYWIAKYVDYGDGRGTYIPTTPISYSKAISYVRSGGSVFADSRSNAYKLAKAVGGGTPARDPAHGELGYWRHYHATRGGKRIGGHVFYVT